MAILHRAQVISLWNWNVGHKLMIFPICIVLQDIKKITVFSWLLLKKVAFCVESPCFHGGAFLFLAAPYSLFFLCSVLTTQIVIIPLAWKWWQVPLCIHCLWHLFSFPSIIIASYPWKQEEFKASDNFFSSPGSLSSSSFVKLHVALVISLQCFCMARLKFYKFFKSASVISCFVFIKLSIPCRYPWLPILS